MDNVYAGATISIEKETPHRMEFMTDAVVVVWWGGHGIDGGSPGDPTSRSHFYIPYRRIVEPGFCDTPIMIQHCAASEAAISESHTSAS